MNAGAYLSCFMLCYLSVRCVCEKWNLLFVSSIPKTRNPFLLIYASDVDV